MCAHFISFVEKSFSLSLDSYYRPESWTNKSDELFEKLYHTSTTVCSRERSVSIIAYQLERTNINERRSNAAGASVRSRKRTGIREVFDEGSRSVLLKLGEGMGDSVKEKEKGRRRRGGEKESKKLIEFHRGLVYIPSPSSVYTRGCFLSCARKGSKGVSVRSYFAMEKAGIRARVRVF